MVRPVLALALAALLLTVAAPAEAQGFTALPAVPEPVRFGVGRADAADMAALGARADYAQAWAGVWNERSGWADIGQWAARAADNGTVPLVEWWYWGDDISRRCVTDGCLSKLHDAWKSQALWAADAAALADALHASLQGREAIVVLESEFNKGRMGTWEDFDAMLVEQAAIFRQRAPEVQLALGFGNWAPEHWATFDRAAAAMDYVGLQGMRGSTRDSLLHYFDMVDGLVQGAQRLQALFGKPVLVHDLAFSSWPAPEYELYQQLVVWQLFWRLGELKAAGVVGIVYRALDDAPRMDLDNYYGEAERHMGFRRADGSAKPSLQAWLSGVQQERTAHEAAVAAALAAQVQAQVRVQTPLGWGWFGLGSLW